MGWRRTQRNNKRQKRGVRASDDEIRKRIRKPVAKPSRIHEPKRGDFDTYEDWVLEMEWWIDQDDGANDDLLDHFDER